VSMREDDPRRCRSCNRSLLGELAKRKDDKPISTCASCRTRARLALEAQGGLCFACHSPLQDGREVYLVRPGGDIAADERLLHRDCRAEYWRLHYFEVLESVGVAHDRAIALSSVARQKIDQALAEPNK